MRRKTRFPCSRSYFLDRSNVRSFVRSRYRNENSLKRLGLTWSGMPNRLSWHDSTFDRSSLTRVYWTSLEHKLESLLFYIDIKLLVVFILAFVFGFELGSWVISVFFNHCLSRRWFCSFGDFFLKQFLSLWIFYTVLSIKQLGMSSWYLK